MQQARVFFNVNIGQSACITTSSLYWGKDTHLFTVGFVNSGARGGAVGWGTALQALRSRVRFPMVSL